jgi:hypothetical protein
VHFGAGALAQFYYGHAFSPATMGYVSIAGVYYFLFTCWSLGYIIVALARGDGSHSEACHPQNPPPITGQREIATTLLSPHLISSPPYNTLKTSAKGTRRERLHHLGDHGPRIRDHAIFKVVSNFAIRGLCFGANVHGPRHFVERLGIQRVSR